MEQVLSTAGVTDFITKVDGLTSVNAVMKAVNATLQDHGIDNYLFSFVALPAETLNDVTLASRVPPGLLAAYNEHGYLRDDPGFRHCLNTVHPFRWFKESPYDAEAEPRAQAVVDLCRDYGLEDGYVLPFCSARQRLGQVWFGGKTIDLPKSAESTLHLMSLYAFDRVLQLKADHGTSQLVALTVRERDALTRIAAGNTTYDTADIMKLSRRTIIAHLNNCRSKLGARTLAHAVMIAMRQRMIEP